MGMHLVFAYLHGQWGYVFGRCSNVLYVAGCMHMEWCKRRRWSGVLKALWVAGVRHAGGSGVGGLVVVGARCVAPRVKRSGAVCCVWRYAFVEGRRLAEALHPEGVFFRVSQCGVVRRLCVWRTGSVITSWYRGLVRQYLTSVIEWRSGECEFWYKGMGSAGGEGGSAVRRTGLGERG